MHAKFLHAVLASLSLLALSSLAVPAHAADGTSPAVTCKDGTTLNATGEGACSHHGGVQKGGASASAHEKTEGKTSDKPTAKCKDGTVSHSQQHSGACSQHGGVAEWLDK
jgi:hypothetical protein